MSSHRLQGTITFKELLDVGHGASVGKSPQLDKGVASHDVLTLHRELVLVRLGCKD